MMEPHSKREMTAAEHIFNYRLSRAHRIVENVFSILANRYVQNACIIPINFVALEFPLEFNYTLIWDFKIQLIFMQGL